MRWKSLAIWLSLVMWVSTVVAAGPQTVITMGVMTLPQPDNGVLTVFYPTQQAEHVEIVGPFHLSWARDAQPQPGNGRLIVISHGSGGSPWVHVDLARALVQRGFVVVLPQHQGDNYQDRSQPGPVSWDKRPREVSMAIDVLATHARFTPWLDTASVGVFGGSAGGHTVLSLVGGQWSPQGFRDHCRQHIEQDFSSCVGMLTLQRGSVLDVLKRWLALRIIDWRFDDPVPRRHHDARIKVGIAMVPFAADFDMQSLAHPRVPLGLVRAGRDVNQIPTYHIDAVLRACSPHCTLLADWPDAGHGAMLSPMPPFPKDSVEQVLLADPPGFDRARRLAHLHERVADFLAQHLGLSQAETLNPYSSTPPQSR